MKKRTLKFIIDNEDECVLYRDIPLDKPISPSVLLCYKNVIKMILQKFQKIKEIIIEYKNDYRINDKNIIKQ